MEQELLNSDICDLCGKQAEELFNRHPRHNSVLVCWRCLVASGHDHPILAAN